MVSLQALSWYNIMTSSLYSHNYWASRKPKQFQSVLYVWKPL